MKLQELGLKSKPQTKYFEGGYIKFRTDDKELSFEVHSASRTGTYILFEGYVQDEQHLKTILAIKTFNDAVRLYV